MGRRLTPARSIARGRRAPRVLSALVLACWPVVAFAFGAAIGTHGGTALAVVDERGAVAARVDLPSPLVALAASAAPDGHVYAALRDGRVVKLASTDGRTLASARVGGSVGTMVATSDGRFLAIAAQQPDALVLLDGDLATLRSLPARDVEGRWASPIVAIADAPPRRAVLAALPGLPEVWEVSYDDDAPPVYPGLVHDFRLGEGIAVPGRFHARRVPLDEPARELLPGASANVVAGGRDGSLQVLNLHVRRRIARIASPAHPSDAARWRGTLALPHGRALRLIDEASWSDTAAIALDAEARFVRNVADAPHAWVVVRDDAARSDRLVRIDKSRRAVSGAWHLPEAGRVIALDFADAGRQVLVLADGPRAGLWRLEAESLHEIGHVALEAPTALLVPPQNRVVTSK